MLENRPRRVADGHSLRSSEDASHRTGIPIAAVDISPDRTHAIVAGRDILKTIQVSGSTCVEDANLRSAIIAYAATHHTSGGAISAKHRDQLAANDVKWSHGKYDSTVATAAANGQIVIYEINRAGVEYGRLHEHVRQVHRVAFNPHQGALLLSGSQDATMRLWDLRALTGNRSIMTCQSAYQYPGNNEGIRDLRWSPTNGMEFAAGTDNGVIQRWDLRKSKSPMLKVNAHQKTCHSIDWHPDGKHLVSGGADKCVHVWDFSSTDRRKKPCWQLRAPQAVLNVRWRPPIWYADGVNPGRWQCTQLATSYDHQDPRIQIWDFRRQYMPLREIDRSDTAPTAMLWHSEALLWSVNLAGIFTQTDVNFAPKTFDRRSANVVDVAPSGEIAFFSDKRVRRRVSLQDTSDEFLHKHRRMSAGGEKLSGSHSATDGSLDEPGLLSSSFKSRHRKAPSVRSSKSVAGTPPSAGSGGPIQRLDEAMQKEFIFHPKQMAALGHIIGLDAFAFKFLAQCYSFPQTRPSQSQDHDWLRALSAAFQQNSLVAARANEYQLAQSWRILSLAAEKDLKSWVDGTVTLQPRDQGKRSPTQLINCEGGSIAQDNGHISTSGITRARAKLMAFPTSDNSSNMTTPMARPIPDKLMETASAGPVPEGDGSLCLPGPAWMKQVIQKPRMIGSDQSALDVPEPSRQNVEHRRKGPNEYAVSPRSEEAYMKNTHVSSPANTFLGIDDHMNERRAANENYRAKPRPLLRLEEPVHESRGNHLAPSLNRHDSNESFQLFSASTDSSRRANSLTGSLGSSQNSEKLGTVPEQWDVINKSIPSPSPESPILLRSSSSEPPIIHLNDVQPLQRSISPTAEGEINLQTKIEPADFTKQASKADQARPWTITSLIHPLILYHTNELSSSQLPAHILLLLGPQLSSSVPPALALSILLTYHEQLTSNCLFVQAAQLRNLAHPLYVDVSDHGNYGVSSGGPWCTVCQKPSKGDKPRFCKRCKFSWADCTICNGEGPVMLMDSDRVQPSDYLWGWCQWCGHGGHMGCLRTWWDNPEISEGGCATEGCLHDCVAGTRRSEVLKRKGEAKKAGTVRGDEWVVGESRAVERARAMVGSEAGARGGRIQSPSSAKGLGGSHGPLSLGVMGRSGSGGKKVRLLVPDESRESHGDVDGEGEAGEAGDSRTSASAP